MYYIHALHNRYGPFVRISPHEISVSDPEAFIQIHRINSGFHKSQWYQDLVSFERPVLFNETEPRAHSIRRRLLARGFSKSYLRQFWEPVVREKIRLVISKMRDEAKGRPSVDVFKWWTLMATDISTQLMFGSSTGAVEKGQKTEYIDVLESALKGGGIGAEFPLLRAVGRYIPLKWCHDLFAANDFLLRVATAAVDSARSSSEHDTKNLFAHIVAESAKNEDGSLTDLDVRLEASGLIVAGSDTTAVTLTYIVWCVLSRPQLHKTLRKELSSLAAGFTDANLEDKCPNLNAVIEETLRLYGAAPGSLPRAVPAEGAYFKVPSNSDKSYFCPPGTIVSTQAYTIHRDPNLFADPERYVASLSTFTSMLCLSSRLSPRTMRSRSDEGSQVRSRALSSR